MNSNPGNLRTCHIYICMYIWCSEIGTKNDVYTMIQYLVPNYIDRIMDTYIHNNKDAKKKEVILNYRREMCNVTK